MEWMSPCIAFIPLEGCVGDRRTKHRALSAKKQMPTGLQLWHQGLCVQTRGLTAAQVCGFDLKRSESIQTLCQRLWDCPSGIGSALSTNKHCSGYGVDAKQMLLLAAPEADEYWWVTLMTGWTGHNGIYFTERDRTISEMSSQLVLWFVTKKEERSLSTA